VGRAAHARPLNPQRGAVLSSTSSDATFTVPRIGTPIGSRCLVSHTEPAGIDRVDEWPSAPTPRQASPCVCPSSAGAFAGSRAPSPGEDESSSASGPAVAHEPLRPSADRSVLFAADVLSRDTEGLVIGTAAAGTSFSVDPFLFRDGAPLLRVVLAGRAAPRFDFFAHHRVMCGAFLACSRCC